MIGDVNTSAVLQQEGHYLSLTVPTALHQGSETLLQPGGKEGGRGEVRRCGGEGDGKGGKDGRGMEGEGEEVRGEGRVRGRREILRDYTAANSSVSSNALYC